MKYFCLKIILTSIVLAQIPVNIVVYPDEVILTIDGIEKGKSPTQPILLNTGTYVIDLQKKGYAPIKYEFDLLESKSVDMVFRLNPLYKVKFRSKTPGLLYEFDNQYRWTQIKMNFEMEAGTHQFKVYRGEELLSDESITINQSTTLTYELEN